MTSKSSWSRAVRAAGLALALSASSCGDEQAPAAEGAPHQATTPSVADAPSHTGAPAGEAAPALAPTRARTDTTGGAATDAPPGVDMGAQSVPAAAGATAASSGPAAAGNAAASDDAASAGSATRGRWFVDITSDAGISFVPQNGAIGEKLLPETMGGGCAFLDHDGDGDADLLLVGGRRWPWDPASAEPQPGSLALYENDGTGHFTDVTVRAGLARLLQGMGPAVGDVEGDGDDDLYITAVGPNVLFRNEGGFFVDGTVAAGVAGGETDWSTAAGFLDLENDGDLDLAVGNYVQWSRESDLAGDRRLVGIPGRAYAPPMAFPGSQPLLFVNRGDGVFDEGAEAAGLHVSEDDGTPVGKMLAFLFVDLDDDLDTDVFVSDDTTRNLLFVNDGAGHFREQGRELGLAYDRFGNTTGAMGVDGGDFAHDDTLAIFVGNFADEMSSAYVSPRSEPYFLDETLILGLGQDTRPALTFGLLLFDADLDGQLDLLQVNGHLEPAIDEAAGGQRYRQPPQLFRNGGQGARPRFAPLPADTLGDLAAPIAGRGAACADIDGDGDLDLLLTGVAEPPRLLRNDGAAGNHWLRCVLKGRPGSPTAIGAEVQLTAGGVTRRLRVDTTRSYLSQCERTLTFGLGTLERIESLSVRWPDGSVQSVAPPAGVDTTLTLVQPVDAAEVQRTFNLAKAQLESGRLADALRSLRIASELAPESAPTWRNLARARLAANDADGALAALDHADAVAPDQLAARYLRAMALLRGEHHAEALPLLEDVVRRDPNTAAVRFHLATALTAQGRADEARAQFEEAVRLDPAHGAAWFQLAVARRRAGDLEGFRSANREFLRLRQLYGEGYKTPLSLEACGYTLAEPAGDAVLPETGRSAPVAPLAASYRLDDDGLLGGARDAAAAAVLSMDGAGRYALVVATPDGALLRLDPVDGGGRLATEVASGLGDLSGLAGIAVGNYLDAAPATLEPGTVPPRLPDLFLYGPSLARLLQQAADGRFVDTTDRAQLDGAFGERALWVDHEHDGDLDLCVAGADGFAVFMNRNDGTFDPSEDLPGLPGVGAADVAAHDLLAADLDDNGAVDFVVATGGARATGAQSAGGAAGATLRIDNLRAGRFALPPDPPGPWPGCRRVLADDLDADGIADVVLVRADGVQFVFDGVPGPLQPLPGLDVQAATFVDPDGDGWLDLLLAGRDTPTADGAAPGDDSRDDGGAIPDFGAGVATGRLVLLRNGGRGTWTDASVEAGLADLAWPTATGGAGAPPAVVDVTAVDLDDDGDQDLLLRSADRRLHALRNDGGEAGGLLKLRLLSLMSPSGALGARVELRAGAFFASRTIQADQPVEIGLGGRTQLDSVLVVWPYGVVDARTDVVPGAEPLSIVVIEKADTGSCPFLYVWDGERMRFINDMVGSGATDLPLARGVINGVNPHEIIVVGPAGQFPLVDGAWDVSITSELREVAYYDEAALLVVDHPLGTEVHSSDRLRFPPFPPSEVLCLGKRVPLRSAVGSDGLDRTAALLEQDGVHAPAGPLIAPPVRGQCAPYELELDFGPLDTQAPLVLALSGWIEFGTASSMIALSQKGDAVVAFPIMEARGADGEWHLVDTTVGLPGGKVRTLTLELGGLLPEGADRLRLGTTFELHWDRAALFERVPLPADAVTEVRPDRAELRWRGFSDLRVRVPTQPKWPDYERVSQEPAFRVCLSGWCTGYGDVLPLMDAEDGRLVVLNSGDELLLRLPADDVGAPPTGTTRTLMWRSVGYNKEADPNNAGAGHVWPLGPDIRYGRTDEQDDAWRLQWNTRWIAPDHFQPHRSGTR